MIDVACAIIVNPEGQVLVTQRSPAMKLPLKFEFPGGKLEAGETARACLMREIDEELNVRIKILRALPPNEHLYPDFSIRLIPFICEISEGTITLKEHKSFYWLDPKELRGLDWAEADIRVADSYLSQI